MTKLQDFLNTPIARLTKGRRAAKAGDLFGVEIECEGARVNWDGSDAILKGWKPEHDGSLRDRHGPPQEWVFNGPVSYDASVQRIHQLFDYFDKNKAKFVCSNRTSVHIHYNMGDKSCYQLVNMFILFTILEGMMDRYCGEDRVGNLFCLSSRHAEEQIEWMNDVVFKYFTFANLRDDWRYCSFNFASLNKFTTVEFRGMRGLDNREDMLNWLSIIFEFCDYASYKMKNPIDVIRALSEEGPEVFLRKIFSKENFLLLTRGINIEDIAQSLYQGLRLVQMLAYRVGTEFDQVRLRGRDFWASFNNNPEPELDVAPEDIKRGRGGHRINPFMRPAEPGVFQEMVDMAAAQPRPVKRKIVRNWGRNQAAPADPIDF